MKEMEFPLPMLFRDPKGFFESASWRGISSVNSGGMRSSSAGHQDMISGPFGADFWEE